MNSVIKLQNYCEKEIENIESKIFSYLKHQKLKKFYITKDKKLLNRLSNPKKKNKFVFYYSFFIAEVYRLFEIEKRDEAYELISNKLELLLRKRIIDDLSDENSNNIFLAFDILNEVMDKINLPYNEKLEIYNYVVNKNLKNRINEKEVKKIDDIKDIENCDCEHAKLIYYLPNKENYIKKRYMLKILNNTFNATREYEVDASDEVIAHEVFKRLYNKEHLTGEEIIELSKALKIFHFKDTEIRKVQSHYKKINEASDKKEINLNLELNTYEKKEQEKAALREELNDFIIIKSFSCELKRFLQYEELKRLVYIWRTLGYDEETLIDAINQNELMVNKLNSNDKYNYYINLLSFYAEKYGLLNELFELNDSFNCGNVEVSKINKMLSLVPNMKEFITKKD